MKVALISDLHANLVALDAVLEDAEKQGVDQVICLGDIVDLGPEPGATIDRLIEKNVTCIQGNHDPLNEKPPLAMLQEIETWTIAQLDQPQSQWLKDLPFSISIDLGGASLLCVHGAPHSYNIGIEPDTSRDDLKQWVANVDEDIIAAGHTHLQLYRRLDDKILINAGSTGLPFEGPISDGKPPVMLKYCDYAIIEQENDKTSVDLLRIPLDFDAFKRSFNNTDYPRMKSWIAQWD